MLITCEAIVTAVYVHFVGMLITSTFLSPDVLAFECDYDFNAHTEKP